jgi:hypothetical protein
MKLSLSPIHLAFSFSILFGSFCAMHGAEQAPPFDRTKKQQNLVLAKKVFALSEKVDRLKEQLAEARTKKVQTSREMEEEKAAFEKVIAAQEKEIEILRQLAQPGIRQLLEFSDKLRASRIRTD